MALCCSQGLSPTIVLLRQLKGQLGSLHLGNVLGTKPLRPPPTPAARGVARRPAPLHPARIGSRGDRVAPSGPPSSPGCPDPRTSGRRSPRRCSPRPTSRRPRGCRSAAGSRCVGPSRRPACESCPARPAWPGADRPPRSCSSIPTCPAASPAVPALAPGQAHTSTSPPTTAVPDATGNQETPATQLWNLHGRLSLSLAVLLADPGPLPGPRPCPPWPWPGCRPAKTDRRDRPGARSWPGRGRPSGPAAAPPPANSDNEAHCDNTLPAQSRTRAGSAAGPINSATMTLRISWTGRAPSSTTRSKAGVGSIISWATSRNSSTGRSTPSRFSRIRG